MFADDVKIYTISNDRIECPILSEALEIIHRWSTVWQLSLAVAKCSVTVFGGPPVEDAAYRIGGQALEYKKEVKDLGVWVGNDLKFSKQARETSRKALFTGSRVFRSFKTRDRSFLIKMFKVYVKPLVSYITPVWNPYLRRDVNAIERVQRSYTKRIPGMFSLSYAERLNVLGLNSLEYERLESDLVLLYRIMHEQVGMDFAEFFEYSPSLDLNLRGHNLKLLVPKCRSKLNAIFYSYLYRVYGISYLRRWSTLQICVLFVKN